MDKDSLTIAPRASASPSNEAAAGAPLIASPAAAPRRRGRIKLPLKTTLCLLTLLVGAVALCGLIILGATRSILRDNKQAQVNQFAYGVAASLGHGESFSPPTLQRQLAGLEKTPYLDFAVLSDTSMKQLAGFYGNPKAWSAFGDTLGGGEARIAGRLGQVQELKFGGQTSYVVTVPVFQDEAGDKAMRAVLVGYLHVATSGEGAVAQLRFLQGFVLLTCMGVVLLAVPIAGLIARHITVPIQRLARGAHALAEGDLSHRVLVRRSDEIGELAEAFNRMADTVQSQRQNIEQTNAGLEQKVHERTAALERLNGQLHAEISEKEDFLRAVSHDLNAPLRNIAGMASMLILKYQDTLEKDAVQRLERIQKNVQVECELINELLELSRIKTRREKIERVDLHELIQSVADQFSSDFETRKITFRLTAQLPVMSGEKSRLRQAFQNLIDNAIKYMRPDGPREITVSVTWHSDEVVFAFRDTGMGIAPEDLPQLFHVFRRAKNASIMKIPGKGVGLASVKSIIENYHGRLWVESTQGVGTTFLFALPRSHFQPLKEVAA